MALPTLVFDVLGTLVDQARSLREQVRTLADLDASSADAVVAAWRSRVQLAERAIVAGDRPFERSHELDAQALRGIVAAGMLPPGAVGPLATAAERLQPWPDTVAGIELLGDDATVMGLSNASRRVLTGLSSRLGLHWHQLLSAEDVGLYKPAPALYRAAIDSAPTGRGAPIMVAAHAWDLRAAAAAGMRTAYVARPGGDPPTPADAFDLHALDLSDLHRQLRSRR